MKIPNFLEKERMSRRPIGDHNPIELALLIRRR